MDGDVMLAPIGRRGAGVRMLVRSLQHQDETGLEQVLGSSITYRIAIGPHQGRKAFSLQTLPQ
jgi:hypothetical protein